MPWVEYKGSEERTLAGVALKPGRNFLQAEEVNRLNAGPAGNRLFQAGELSMAEVREAPVPKTEPKPEAKSPSKSGSKKDGK